MSLTSEPLDVAAPGAAASSGAPARARRGGQLWRLVRRDPGALLGLAIVLLFLICAVFAPLLAPYDPNFQHRDGISDLGEPIGPGDSKFLLGTDNQGRDVLSRLIYGARVAMVIAAVPNLLALVFALFVGVTAAYLGGRVEWLLMRMAETMMVLPTFLIAVALIAVLGSGLGLIVLALALTSWAYYARVFHGETLRLKQTAYVEAARSMGARPIRVILRHITPQLRTLFVAYFAMNACWMVVSEAGLGYLGLGVPPPTASWGQMIASGSRFLYWPWMILLAGGALALLGSAFYLVGSGIQRQLGPRPHKVRL